jgi:uncharacterized membrane protein YbhN (UPF0104 family)
VWRWARLGLGAAVLGGVVWRLGGAPFLAGLRAVDARLVVLALALNGVATVAAAARWRAVATRLGAGLSLPAAVGAYYRAQLLNVTLPGGVLGDVHRGVRHGRESADVRRGVRAVVTERAAGQVVQLAVAGVLLVLCPGPFRVIGAALLAAGSLLVGGAIVLVPGEARALLSNRLVLVTSAVVVVAHLTTFVVAAEAVHPHLATARVVPVAALVLVAMAVPLNVGGWGPREGVAAWAFAAAGLGAAAGVVTAVVYGVLAFAAALPGAAVLVTRRAESGQSDSVDSRQLLAVGAGDGARG